MKNKAVFLDRDGVLNREIGDYVCRVDDFVVNPGVGECLRKFADKGYLLIMISNQGGIAKGRYTLEELGRMHQILLDELDRHGVGFAEMYFCRHHPQYTQCLCRKPLSLFFEKAIARFQLDPDLCVMIGDTERDIVAANGAGVRGIRVVPNEYLLDNPHVQAILS